MTRTTTVLTAAGVTAVVGGLVAYAVYFDHKRRNDAEFRKQLRKEKKKAEKLAAQSAAVSSTSSSASDGAAGPLTITKEDLRAAIETVKSEAMPTTPEDREPYFMSQVSMGEKLCTQGPAFTLPAAMCFFRALRVYPAPVELIMVYQQTVPEPVFKVVMEMTQLDVLDRVEGYYDSFPPKRMDVSAKQVEIPDATGAVMRKSILVVNREFKAGDVIYKEQPIVAALDADLEAKGTHCSHCLREMNEDVALQPPGDKLGSVYCSKGCQAKAKTQSQNLLFGSEPPVPLEINPTITPEDIAKRVKAQDAFVEFIKASGKAAPLLVSRFLARQVAGEIAKMVPAGSNEAAADEYDSPGYTLYDHIERLRYLELEIPAGETTYLQEVLETALPGLEKFVTDERYATLKGKMAYNAFGISYGGGRDDKPLGEERPEDTEKTRTPSSTERQVGSGLYAVSAYLQHDCEPTAHPLFSNGTAELHLVASRDLKEGEQLTVAFVDVTRKDDESVVDGRRRRRIALARGWRFACTCQRCAKEDPGKSGEAEPIQGDESKVEESAALNQQRAAEATTTVD